MKAKKHGQFLSNGCENRSDIDQFKLDLQRDHRRESTAGTYHNGLFTLCLSFAIISFEPTKLRKLNVTSDQAFSKKFGILSNWP